MNDSRVTELLATYRPIKEKHDKLYAAHAAIGKKLTEARAELQKCYERLHAEIGLLAPKTLATNLHRSRYCEVVRDVGQSHYQILPVQAHTGKYGKGSAYWRTARPLGALLPVTDPNDPVYLKWQKHKFCKILEGGDDAGEVYNALNP